MKPKMDRNTRGRPLPPNAVVYVVQEPLMLDSATGRVRARFSMRPATRYGRVEYLIGWSEEYTDTSELLWKLRERLQDYGDADYLLMTGSPTMMAIASMIAAEVNHGRVKLLNWDNLIRQYTVEAIDLNAQPVGAR